jgi:hypothetical protein
MHMNIKHIQRAAVLVAAAAAAASASAEQIVADTNTIANPTAVVTFNDFDGLLTTGPVDVGPVSGQIVFSSVPFAMVGAFAQDLNENGLWGARGTPDSGLVNTPTGDGNFLSSAFVGNRGEVGFSFATPVSSVGAFFNQYREAGVANSMLLIAYDGAGNVLESFSYSVNTAFDSYNEGKFLGFSRPTADIYGFGIADGTFVMDNLTVAVGREKPRNLPSL